MQGMKLLIFLKKGFFHIMIKYLKQKKKRNQKKNRRLRKKLDKNEFFKNIEDESKDIRLKII